MKYTLDQRIKQGSSLLWNDIKAAKWVIIFIIAYFVFLKRFFYSTCPMVLITGFPCPACGMTRAGFSLLRFDFADAFHTQPFIYGIALYAGIFAVNRYILLRKFGKVLKWLLIGLIFGMIVYYIWRMICFFPGEPPMSYYHGSMLGRIIAFLK